ncbi:MAG: hypothetical protein U0269_10995 [Polyangiales bacterium]
MTASHPSLSILFRADNNVVALYEQRVVLFARSGPLTENALRAAADTALLLSAVARDDERYGFIGVVPAEAGVSNPALFDVQLSLFRSVGAVPHVYAALCVLGDSALEGPMAQVARSLSELLPNSQLFADTASASRWIGEKLSLDPRSIQRAVLELVFAA